MATLTPEPPHSTPTLDYLSYVDITTLTQSELLALSRCSSSAVRPSDGDVSASIDRSTFNESAGSRRQTFCRPGFCSPSASVHHRSRVAVAGRLASSSTKSLAISDAGVDASDDPHHGENRRIIASLKQCLRNLPEFYDIDFDYAPPSSFANYSPSLCGGGERKRKRGRKPKPKPENLKPEEKSVTVADDERETGLEIVNEKGNRVDLAALASLEDPYGPELRRRTEGMSSEEELLGFLRDLGGQWCSRRRKRKIVDAGVLGDFLPVGWKLLLALKRKERRAWVYCRRIVSPGGRHFLSCKEVSTYLQSHFENHGVPSLINQDRSSFQQDDHQSVSQMDPDATLKEDADKQSDEHHNLTAALGSDSLEEVKVQDLFECQKCNSTFDKKDEYLQHLISVHQRTTRRYRLGASQEDGETVKDEKFECEFCHEVFYERCQYNGHLRIHVGTHDEGVEEQPDQLNPQQRIESTTKDESGIRISRMDALIEIAQNSMLEASPAPSPEATDGSISDELNVVSEGGKPASGSENETISNFSVGGVESEDRLTLDQDFGREINENIITGEKMENVEDTIDIDIKASSHLGTPTTSCAHRTNGSQSETFPGKYGSRFTANRTEESVSGKQQPAESCLAIPAKNQEFSVVLNEVNSIQGGALDPLSCGGEGKSEHADFLRINFGPTNDALASVRNQESLSSQLQPSQDLQTCNKVSKGEDKSYNIDQSDDSVARYGELHLDDMEQLKLNFVAGQVSHPIPLVPMGLAENTGMEEAAYGSSVQFQAQEVVLGMTGGNHLTTVCMWCGIEFSHHALDSEPQSDSVGYMCLTCKARISGQIGTPDAASNLTSHFF